MQLKLVRKSRFHYNRYSMNQKKLEMQQVLANKDSLQIRYQPITLCNNYIHGWQQKKLKLKDTQINTTANHRWLYLQFNYFKLYTQFNYVVLQFNYVIYSLTTRCECQQLEKNAAMLDLSSQCYIYAHFLGFLIAALAAAMLEALVNSPQSLPSGFGPFKLFHVCYAKCPLPSL